MDWWIRRTNICVRAPGWENRNRQRFPDTRVGEEKGIVFVVVVGKGTRGNRVILYPRSKGKGGEVLRSPLPRIAHLPIHISTHETR